MSGYGPACLETLERGVNFFILALEQLGAKTNASCEGHPHGFYVWFSCDDRLARRIHDAGYFAVEMSRVGWCMRISNAERMMPLETGEPWNESYKADLLRQASEAWAKTLNLQPFWEAAA